MIRIGKDMGASFQNIMARPQSLRLSHRLLKVKKNMKNRLQLKIEFHISFKTIQVKLLELGLETRARLETTLTCVP